jgi:hypothetical protein
MSKKISYTAQVQLARRHSDSGEFVRPPSQGTMVYGVLEHKLGWVLGPYQVGPMRRCCRSCMLMICTGRNILVSTRRLKALSLPEGANNILINAVTGAGVQVGHCFVSQWMHMGDRVWWITQLVVRPEYRDQRRATKVSKELWCLMCARG